MKLPIVPNPSGNMDVPIAASSTDLRPEELFDVLTAFYVTIEGNPMLAPYFANLDMPAHMPRIVAFWETIVFQLGTYNGNAFKPHLSMPGLAAGHFAQWVETMEHTIDERAAGPNAERMKDMAHRIAYSMQLRLGITPFAEWKVGP